MYVKKMVQLVWKIPRNCHGEGYSLFNSNSFIIKIWLSDYTSKSFKWLTEQNYHLGGGDKKLGENYKAYPRFMEIQNPRLQLPI